MISHRVYKSMYAVSCEGIGIIAGTLAYSRREAIRHFHGGTFIPKEWEGNKRAGYRTVKAMVKIIDRKRWRQ